MTITVTNIYNAGTPVLVSWSVQDMTQVGHPLADPTTITFKYQVESGSVTTLTYPGGGITRASTGLFSVTLDTTAKPGGWFWSVTSTGVQGADDGEFYVQALTP